MFKSTYVIYKNKFLPKCIFFTLNELKTDNKTALKNTEEKRGKISLVKVKIRMVIVSLKVIYSMNPAGD